MKVICLFSVIVCLVSGVPQVHAEQTTNLIRGLTYNDGAEKLSGKLVFLAQGPVSENGAQTNGGTIYAFDLTQKTLRQVVSNCPNGNLLVAEAGDLFCILHGESRISPYVGTDAFVYSDYNHQIRRVKIGNPPNYTLFAGTHVIFELSNGGGILDLDTGDGAQHIVELPGASRYQYQKFADLRRDRVMANIVYFEYEAYGNRITDGSNYANGTYTLNIETGRIAEGIAGGHPYKPFEKTALDGRHIIFAGDDPLSGRKLVSAGKDLRVLTRFSLLRSGRYCLEQISPCRRYALVRHEESIWTHGDYGESNTYYIVNVVNGETRLLVRDDVDREGKGHVSKIWWVRSGEAEHELTNSFPDSVGTNVNPTESVADLKAAKEEFLGIRIAVLHTFGQYAKAKGYKVVFTDLGPESLERDDPKAFSEFLQKASQGGVDVRGLSRASVDQKFVRDKDTGEKGVIFNFLSVENADGGGYMVTGMWEEAETVAKIHEVHYHVVRQGEGWRAE